MMNRGTFHVGTLLLCLMLSACSGSGDGQPASSGDDHGHDHGHDHSAEARLPFDTLVVRICEHRDAIKTAFDGDNRDEAHDPLHEIGHLIAQLPDSAAETDLVESDWDQVKQASDKLMAAFGKVDALFHGDKEGVEYSSIEQDVQDSITVLQEKVAIVANDQQDSQP